MSLKVKWTWRNMLLKTLLDKKGLKRKVYFCFFSLWFQSLYICLRIFHSYVDLIQDCVHLFPTFAMQICWLCDYKILCLLQVFFNVTKLPQHSILNKSLPLTYSVFLESLFQIEDRKTEFIKIFKLWFFLVYACNKTNLLNFLVMNHLIYWIMLAAESSNRKVVSFDEFFLLFNFLSSPISLFCLLMLLFSFLMLFNII